MVQNPRQLLGVSENATPEEIKRAYRRKAKECHPDLHPNDPEAARKMNELNEAYDMLMNPDKYAHRQQQNPYGQSGRGQNPYGQNPYGSSGGDPFWQRQRTQQGNPYGSYQGSGGWQSDFGFDFNDFFGFGGYTQAQVTPPQIQVGDSDAIRAAINAINQGQFQAACYTLQNIPSTGRNARWYYLSGVANHGAGNSILAVDHMSRACQMAPNNPTYQALLRQYRQSGQTYQQYASGYNTRAADPSRYCMNLCLLNLLCNLCCCRPC